MGNVPYMHFLHADMFQPVNRLSAPSPLREEERNVNARRTVRCDGTHTYIWGMRTRRVRIDSAWTNTAKAFCGLGSFEKLRHAAAASFAAATTSTRTIGVWVSLAGGHLHALTAVPLDRSCSCSLSSLFWVMNLASMHPSIHWRKITFVVGVFKLWRLRHVIARRHPARCLGTRFCHASNSICPTRLHPFSQHMLPCPTANTMAQFQTRHLSLSRAEISRQLKVVKRDCQKQPQATETDGNIPPTALRVSAC
jgi:hypothetical protein